MARTVCNCILRSVLHIDEEYGLAGTCEPFGPIDENKDLNTNFNYNYGDNKIESYNIIIVIPKIIEDLNDNSYFIGYSRKNNTGTFPKSMVDFNCIASEIIKDIGYVPREFILAYQVYGPDIEEKFVINPNHISFLSDDLQKIFGMTKDKILRENINTFSLNDFNEDLIISYANPIIKTKTISAMQNTALEFFEYYAVNQRDLKKL